MLALQPLPNVVRRRKSYYLTVDRIANRMLSCYMRHSPQPRRSFYSCHSLSLAPFPIASVLPPLSPLLPVPSALFALFGQARQSAIPLDSVAYELFPVATGVPSSLRGTK